MKENSGNIVRSFLVVIVLFLLGQDLYAQEIDSPKRVIADFKKELAESTHTGDTVDIYVRYIKRLVARGNYHQADSIMMKSDSDFVALSDSSFLADIYKERAFMYKVQRRFPKSLQDYLWLKSYYEAKDSKNDLIEIYSLLAEYYRAFRNFDLMDKHLRMAEILIKQIDVSPENLAYWYSRKAAWSTEYLGNQDSVEYYAQEGLKLAKQSGSVYTHALLLNELGHLAMHKGEVDLMLDYFERSKTLLFENQRYRDYVDVVNNLASWTSHSLMEQSLESLELCIAMEQKNDWYTPMIRSLEIIKGLYLHFDQPEKSDESQHQLYEARINEIKSANAIAVSDLALTYEKTLTEKELEVQEHKTKIAESDAKSNLRAFVIAVIIAAFLLIISVIIVQVNLRFRRKNEFLNKQRAQIQKANSYLEKSLGQQRILFKELNHRVKNNLSILTGLIYLQEVDEQNNDFKKTLGTLRNRIKSMALAHESLYSSEEAEKIDFQTYLTELFLELSNALADAGKIKTHIECQGFELGLQQAVPLAMIVNELFTNSIKHGFSNLSNGTIWVKAHHEADVSLVEYIDNGKGLPLEQKERGTLGLRLVGLLLEQMNATLEDKSGESGVHFVLTIPVA